MILGLYGASGLGSEYVDLVCAIDPNKERWSEIIFIDDSPEKDGSTFYELPVLSFARAHELYGTERIEYIISIGEPAIKDVVYKKLKAHNCRLTMLIHPTVFLPSSAQLGEGLVAQKFCNIPPMANLGTNVLLQGYSDIGHGVILGDNVVISSFAFVGGETVVGKNTYIAPHACIRNGLQIGANTVVGMGSVVTKDLPDGVVAFGQPCKVMRTNENCRVFSK